MSRYTVPHLDRSVLLTIDVQRDFALSGGAAEILGTAEVLPAIRTLVQAFREKERPIGHVVRLYLEDGSNAEPCRREGIEAGRTIVVPGSLGSELVDEVLPTPSVKLDAPLLHSGALQKIGLAE
jgi:nicotinamidase-related amidase